MTGQTTMDTAESRNHWNHRLPQNQARYLDELREVLLSRRQITESGCWEWTGSLGKSGYGKIKWRPVGDLRVHRVAAMLWLGFELTDMRKICHKCDNRRCFNPDHLFAGTDKDNQIDCVRKGRHFHAKKTHCKYGHPFSPENTWVYKGNRRCRKCHVRMVLEARRRRRVRQ